MAHDSYPYVQPDVPNAYMYKFPPLLTLKPPPLPDDLPQLPCAPRSPTWLPSEWSHSTHIIPAAYPRIGPQADLPALPVFDASLSKAARRAQLTAAELRLREIRDNEMQEWPAKRNALLWICMDRYVRKERDGKGVTLFLAHANGFNKETWEPMLKHLLSRDSTISEIWIWETVNHGDSAILNRGKLDAMFHWHEGVRDLLHFLVHYLPSDITTDLPLHPARINGRQYSLRLTHGFDSRKLVMVGHSFGGTLCALAAIYHPVLFSSLFLIDPVMLFPKPPYATRDAQSNRLATDALGRRETWDSREEAREAMLRSPFFQRFDKDVLQAYIDHGLYDTEDGKIRLKVKPVQEAVLFSDTWTGAEEAYVRLFRGELDERVEIRWLVPGRGQAELGGPGQTQPRVWLRKKNVSNALIDGAGHLITHEKPREVAEELHAFIERKYGGRKSKL